MDGKQQIMNSIVQVVITLYEYELQCPIKKKIISKTPKQLR